MAQRFSISEARSRLPSIVNRAEAGAEVELTRRGGDRWPSFVSHREIERLRGKRMAFADAYTRFRDMHRLEDIRIASDFAASARDKAAGRRVSF